MLALLSRSYCYAPSSQSKILSTISLKSVSYKFRPSLKRISIATIQPSATEPPTRLCGFLLGDVVSYRIIPHSCVENKHYYLQNTQIPINLQKLSTTATNHTMKKYFAVLLAICSLTASAHKPIDTALGNVTADNARLTVNHPSADSIGAPTLTDKESVISRHYRNYKLRPFTAPLMFTMTLGTRIGLGGTGETEWLGPNTASMVSCMRISYYLLGHWGIYGEFGVMYLHGYNNWQELLGLPNLLDNNVDPYYNASASPFFNLGCTYQTSFQRWIIQGYAGFGAYTGRNDLKGIYNNPEEYVSSSPIIEIKRDNHFRALTFGATIGYGKSRGWKWVIDLAYRIPLDKCNAFVLQYDNNSESHEYLLHPPIISSERHTAWLWGHELVVTFGFQGICDTRKKTPRHRRQASELFY